VAGLAALASVVPLLVKVGGDEPTVWIPAVFLLVAAVVVHVPRLGLQLLARAGWWSNLALGMILTLMGSDGELRSGASLAVGCGVALLVAGPGLAAASERDGFAPAQSRTALLVLMVLALADAQTFALFGAIEDHPAGFVLLALAAAYVGGFVGLVRLAAWGPVVTTATSVVALVVFGLRLVRVDKDFVPVIVALASLQILAGGTVLLAAVRGRPLLPPLPARLRGRAGVAVIALLLALAFLRLAGVIPRL